MQRMALIEQRIMQWMPAQVQVWRATADAASSPNRNWLQPLFRWLGTAAHSAVPVRAARPDHSLTHAGNSLFALAVRGSGIAGVGIDFEPWRELDSRHQRLMLTQRENQLIKAASARDLLRIWTVKEACFKADCDGQQRWVTSYELHRPVQKSGSARNFSQGRVHQFRYISLEVPGGVLSVAFKMEP